MWGANKIFPSGTTCATCLCQDRTLYPVKDSKSFSVYCYSLNVSPKDVVCWECNHFVLKMAIFRNRALTARAYRTGKLIWDPNREKSLSNLSISKGVNIDVTAPDPLQVEIKTEPILTQTIKTEQHENNLAVNEEENIIRDNTTSPNKEISGSKFLSTVSNAYFTVYPHIENAKRNKPPDIQVNVSKNAPKPALKKTSANTGVGNGSKNDAVKTQVFDEGVASATLMSLLTKKSTLKVPAVLEKVVLDDSRQNVSSVDTADIETSHKDTASNKKSKVDITNSLPSLGSIPAPQDLPPTEVLPRNEKPYTDAKPVNNPKQDIHNVNDKTTRVAICDDSDDDADSSATVTSVLNGFITLYPQRNDEKCQHTDVNMESTTSPMLKDKNEAINNNVAANKPIVAGSMATASLMTLLNTKSTTLKIPPVSKRASVKKQPTAKSTKIAKAVAPVGGQATDEHALSVESRATAGTPPSGLRRPGVSTADLVAQARRTSPWYARALPAAEAAAARAAARAAPAFAAAPYTCAPCLRVFASEEDRRAHGAAHDPSSGALQCDVCTQRFRTESERAAHATQHATRYCCCQCDYRTEHIAEMRRHNCEPDAAMWKYKRRRRKMPRHVRCKVCYSAFTDDAALGRHMGRMHPVPETPVCATCHKQFKNRSTLNAHRASVHKMKERPGRPELFCAECGLQFHSPCSFRNHRLTLKHSSREDWQYECDICKKKFPTKMFIRSHIRVFHNRELACQCPECGKSLLSPARLRAHRRSHASERAPPRFVCHHCGKAVKTKRSLAEHLSRHEDRRPFACPLCPATFTYRAVLYTHNRRKHLNVGGNWKKPKKPKAAQPQTTQHEES